MEKDNKGATRFKRRRIGVFGILLLLTVVQGNHLSVNPFTLAPGNTPEDTSLTSTYAMEKNFVDTLYEITQLTFNTAKYGAPAISGDGSRIAFVSEVDGDYEVFSLRVPPSDPEDDSWRPRTPMPTPRNNLAAVVVNERIYAIGGFNGTHIFAIVEEYDPATDTWRSRAPMPTARGWLAATVVEGKIYVLGGWDGTKYLPTVEEYDPATDTWRRWADMPTHRYGLAAVAVGGRIYALAGQNEIGPGYLTIVEEYNLYTDTWRPRASMSTPRYGLAAVRVRSEIFALGGLNAVDGYLASMEVYDTITNQ